MKHSLAHLQDLIPILAGIKHRAKQQQRHYKVSVIATDIITYIRGLFNVLVKYVVMAS